MNKRLVKINKTIKTNTDLHNGFLKELGVGGDIKITEFNFSSNSFLKLSPIVKENIYEHYRK